MNGGLAGFGIIGATKCLPIDGNDLPFTDLRNRLHPGHETLLKLMGIDHGKDPIKGIMGGNPMGKFKERTQPLDLGISKIRDRHPQSSAPQITAQMAMTMISGNK